MDDTLRWYSYKCFYCLIKNLKPKKPNGTKIDQKKKIVQYTKVHKYTPFEIYNLILFLRSLHKPKLYINLVNTWQDLSERICIIINKLLIYLSKITPKHCSYKYWKIYTSHSIFFLSLACDLNLSQLHIIGLCLLN